MYVIRFLFFSHFLYIFFLRGVHICIVTSCETCCSSASICNSTSLVILAYLKGHKRGLTEKSESCFLVVNVSQLSMWSYSVCGGLPIKSHNLHMYTIKLGVKKHRCVKRVIMKAFHLVRHSWSLVAGPVVLSSVPHGLLSIPFFSHFLFLWICIYIHHILSRLEIPSGPVVHGR